MDKQFRGIPTITYSIFTADYRIGNCCPLSSLEYRSRSPFLNLTIARQQSPNFS
ncbi:MAG: hypothetical protein WBA93_05350 [Microcoleaceae cyanobacterium]